MAHKLHHGLSERPEYPLDGLIEIDESYYGGRGKPESRGRGRTDPNKSLMAIAVETVPASPRRGEGIKKSHFVAGSARIITDGLKSYDGLADSFRHYSIVQDGGKNADAVLPIIHVLFSNVKPGSTAPSTTSAPSMCRAMRASGTTASIAADASPI